MRDRIVALLEKADLALASAAGLVDEQALTPLIEAVKAVRARTSYPDDVLVVALAGGTGSGKSSLLNAICDEELVDVGGMRPTTSHAAAATPEHLGDTMDGFLGFLGIGERHHYDGDRLCLVDLPDTDSVEVEHRHRVDSLLGRVDLVVWVTDPEKYRDARLHDEYLRPLARYGGQFLFVMNQIDRLSPAEAEEVCHDLAGALASDGLGQVEVFPVAASPAAGPPIGVDVLVSALVTRDRSGLYEKLLDDLEETTRDLARATGGSLDFDARASRAVDDAARALVDDDHRRATDLLTTFLDDIESEVGGDTGDRIALLAADVPSHVRRVVESGMATPQVRQRGLLRRPETAPAETGPIAAQLAEAVVRPARALLAKRALAVASIAELSVEIQSIRARASAV